MKRERFFEAINLFKTRYGSYPLSAGYPAVELDEDQEVYLFAKTGKHLKAFQRKEKLFVWLFKWALPLTAVVLTVMIVGLLLNPSSIMVLNFAILGGISSAILLTLGTLFRKEKNFTTGKVIWIHFPPKPAHLI